MIRDEDEMPSPAEFDAYADGYQAGMESPIKALVGESSEDFIRVKTDYLERFHSSHVWDPTGHLLDYGCGTASLLEQALEREWPVSMTGVDTSSAMLAEARRRLARLAREKQVTLIPQVGGEIPQADGSCTMVIASSVLHHMPSGEHMPFVREATRLLKPGGILIILEHNPHNPVTRFVVSRTPIDRNAVLISASQSRRLLQEGGFVGVTVGYLMFLPPRWRRLRTLEHRLHRTPLGGQYAVVGERPG